MKDDTANEFQIGGNHYASPYQHWDLALKIGMGYLDGVATKYLARWRKAANPETDLLKAKHYVEKLIENFDVVSLVSRRPVRFCRLEANRFCNVNKIEGRDRQIFILLCSWEIPDDLIIAKELLAEMVKGFAKPVPASDSNKHAERLVPRQVPGANGMKVGDRVIYKLDGRRGVLEEVFQDGDAEVKFDDGQPPRMVKWNFLVPE